MITHEPGNNEAQCYFWCFKDATQALPDTPGPAIVATEKDKILVSVTNDLDEPHSFFVPGLVDTGPIAPGQTVTKKFRPRVAGTYMYYDNLNEPVNRVMGLHGTLIVMPRKAKKNHRFTPYKDPTSNVQKLFDDLGSTAHWPGLAWEEGDPSTNTPPFRQWVWLCHQARSRLFAEVGDLAPGQIYSASEFVAKFSNYPWVDPPAPSDVSARGSSGSGAVVFDPLPIVEGR